MSDSFIKCSTLPQNKIFVLVFRAFAFLFAVWGILAIMGVFKNKFHPMSLMMYTIQSNILVAVFFGILLAKTILHICGSEQQPKSPTKPYGFFPRLSAVVTLAIFVTMLIYWLILVPTTPGTGIRRFLAPDNLAVHLITPLFMLADYLIFTERGELKKYDPLLCTVIPYIYLAEVMIPGLTRTVRYDFMGSDSHFPYIFLDVDRFGAWVILMVAGITIIFLGIAFSWRYLDKKLGQKNRKSQDNSISKS